MAVLHLRVPPEEFSKDFGDSGAYSVDEKELFNLPYGSTVELEDTKIGRSFKVLAGDWKEYGTPKEGRVYLPIQYFAKK